MTKLPFGNKTDFAELEAEDYIVKLAKIDLELQPQWNPATNSFDASRTKLGFNAISMPYKLKAEDGLKDLNGNEVKPLTKWLFRNISLSTGTNQEGEPSKLRSLVMAAMAKSLPADADLNEIFDEYLIVDADSNEITGDKKEQYVKEKIKLIEGKITDAQFPTEFKGYSVIPDIRGFEGMYVSAKVILNKKGKNSLLTFSKLPVGFKADPAIEAEAMTKFTERYGKYKAKKAGNASEQAVSGNVSEEVITPENLPF